MTRGWWLMVALAGCTASGTTPPEPAGSGETAPAPARPAAAETAETRAARDARITQAIGDLASDDPRARDAALETLVTIGAPAVERLRAARSDSADPELRRRVDRALEVLGEEGTYVEAIDAVMRQDYRVARTTLERYLGIARGRYRGQAEYLFGEVLWLLGHQEEFRPITGGTLKHHQNATAEEWWLFASHHHNVFLFFRSRGVPAPYFLEQARFGYAELLRTTPSHRRGWACLASLLVAAEEPEEAARAFKRATELAPASGWDLMDDAAYHAARGDVDRAVAVLAECLPRCEAEARRDGHDPDHPRRWVRESNDFDALRGDPRFEELVRADERSR